MFWTLLVAIGLAWGLQSFASFKQTKAFADLFVAMRQRGRVAMGKFRGGLVAGAIVLFTIDDDGIITEGQRLDGVSVLARFKPMAVYTGQHVAGIDPAHAARWGKSVVKAVANARDNYRVVTDGGQPVEPPTALMRSLAKLPGIKPRRPVTS